MEHEEAATQILERHGIPGEVGEPEGRRRLAEHGLVCRAG
jgi:hypothetical protein